MASVNSATKKRTENENPTTNSKKNNKILTP